MGYHRAGFDVVGIDIAPQPNYPFEFHQLDAMEVLRLGVEGSGLKFQLGIDAIHASPPCQAYAETANSRKRTDHPDLVAPVRELLEQTGLPWVIENIPTAPLIAPTMLCGSSFGLPIVRHRAFETSFPVSLAPSLCPQTRFGRSTDHGKKFAPYARKSWRPRWIAEVIPVVWPWMTVEESGEAIPPEYTEWLGLQLLELMGAAA